MTLLQRSRLLRWLLLACVLALSAAIQFTVVAHSETDAPLRADSRHYFSYAWNLRHEGVFSGVPGWDGDPAPRVPDAITTPGYPLFLLAIPGLAPNHAFVHRVGNVQAAMGVLAVLLTYLIASSFLSASGALWSALLTALSPHLASFSTYLLTESLFMIMLLLSVLATVRAFRRGGTGAFALAGAVWGLCSLVRPTMQLLPPLFLLAAVAWPGLRAQRRAAAWLFVCFLAVQSPWMVRKALLPENGPRQNLMIDFLQHGSYPDFMYEGRPDSYGFPYAFDPNLEQSTRSVGTALANIAGHFRDEPLRYARWYVLGKPGKFLSWDMINGYGDIFPYPPLHSPYLEDPLFARLRLLALLLHWPLMLAGLGGALFAALRPRALGLDAQAAVAARVVAVVAVYAVAFHMVGAPFPRYSVPFRPLFYAFAVLLVATPWRRRNAAWASAPPVPAAMLPEASA